MATEQAAQWRTVLPLAAGAMLLLLLLLLPHALSAEQQARAPDELMHSFEARCGNRSSELELNILNIIKRYKPHTFECNREPSSWRWLYADELGAPEPGAARSRVLVKEGSIDERLANLLYTSNSARMLSTDPLRINTGSAADDARLLLATAGPKVDDQKCGAQLEQMLELAADLGARVAQARQVFEGEREARARPQVVGLNSSHIQLARVLESFGRYVAGQHSGMYASLGAWQQCMHAQLELPAEQAAHAGSLGVPTRYCLARLRTDTDLHESLRNRRPNVELQSSDYLAGICVPQSCHSKSFAPNAQLFQRLVDSQFKLPSEIYVRESLPIASIYCPVDSDSEYGRIPTGGRLLIGLLGAWLLLIVGSTWANYQRRRAEERDLKQDDEQRGLGWRAAARRNANLHRLTSCFDLAQVWAEFMRARHGAQPAEQAVDLSMLAPVRIALCLFLMLGHSFVVVFNLSAMQLPTMRELGRGTMIDAFMFGSFALELFFIISAMLSSYLITKKAAERREQQLSKAGAPAASPLGQFVLTCAWLLLLRAVRLLPIYYLLFWFKTTIFARLEPEHPFWDAGLNKDTINGACTLGSSWYTPLLFNYELEFGLKKCVAQGWYITADILASLVYTPIVLLHVSKPRLAKLLAALVLLACLALIERQFLALATPDILWELESTKMHGFYQAFVRLFKLAVMPHAHLPFSLMGAFAGIALHDYERRQRASAGQALELDALQLAPLASQQRGAGSSSSASASAQPEPEALEKQQQHGQTGGRSHWPAWFKWVSTRVALPLPLALLVLSSYARTLQAKYAVPNFVFLDYAHLNGITRAITCLSSTLVFLRLVTDWRSVGWLRSLATPYWQRATKLTFLIYLLHIETLIYLAFFIMTQFHYAPWRFIHLFGTVSFYTILLALLVHLVIETPIALLSRKYLQPA